MQTPTRLIVLFLVLSCGLLAVDAKHTLLVDDIVPSSTNSVLIQHLVTDHIVVTEANIQFVKLNPTPGASFVADTLGPISFDTSFLNFNSDQFVTLESGNNFNVQTPESIASTGDQLKFDSDRLFMTTGNNFVINSHGNIEGTSLRQHINSLSTLDLHTGVGSLDLIGGVSTTFAGQNVRFDGDNRVSFYSYNTLSIDALNNFQAYGAFIDFDSYGDINIESVTGNVEINSVRELNFVSDVITVSAPVGVELGTEHANAYINAADNLFVDAGDLVYLDMVDEAFFTNTGNVDALSEGDINVYAGNNINAISRFIQYTGSEINLDNGNTVLNTGGDILLRMNALPGLIVDYIWHASENMAFTSANIYGNATYVSLESNLGDVNLAALDGVNSLAQFTARDYFNATAGNLMSLGGSAVGFLSASFHYEATDADILATSGVYDSILFNSGDRIDASATNIYGNFEVGSFVANAGITIGVAPGNFIGTADNEIDESVQLSAGRNWNINAAGTVSVTALKGNGYLDAEQYFVTATSYSLVSQTELHAIAQRLTADAAQSLTMNLQEAFFESQRLDVKSTLTDITLEGEIIQFWANADGSFTAANKITVDTTGDLNFSAFGDINVSNLIRLTSLATTSFEANRHIHLSATNGNIQWDNTGTFDIFSNSASDITYDGQLVKITADTRTYLDSGFVSLIAGVDVITKADLFTVDTLEQKNVNFNYDVVVIDVSTAPAFATSSGNIIFDVDGVNKLTSQGVLTVTAATGVDINLLHPVLYQGQVDLSVTAANDVLLATTGTFTSQADNGNTVFTFSRYYDAHLLGDLSFTAGGGITVNGGDDLTFTQNPGAGESTLTTLVADNLSITMSGDYTQDGGSTKLTTGSYSITSADRIQHGSFTKSVYTLSTGAGVNYDATNTNSNVHLLSSDLDVATSGNIAFSGGDVTISSEDSEYLVFMGQTLVSLTSGANSPITWNAAYDWNVTAVNGLHYTAAGVNSQNVAISLLNNADTFSDLNLLVRQGATSLTSNDTQTFDADRIVLKAQSDIYYKNPFPAGSPGGVRFDTQGSDHDGLYGDQAGISVRTTFDNSWIWFNITLGQALINSGYDLHQTVSDSQSRFYSDEEIRLLAQNGDVDIGSAGGSVVFQATQRNVAFTTNKNTELQASAVIDVLAGQEINLVSSGAVSKFPQDYHLGMEFSAEAGFIVTQANTGFPILFQGRNFDLTSGEQTYFRASDNIPITSSQGKFIAIGETGLYYTVENGDLNLDASANIHVQSAKNFDVRVISGLDSTWNAQTKNFTSLAGIDTILRNERLDTTFQTLDPLGDISISGGGQVRFQSDGTDDSVGGVNVDGIFFDAPNINSYSEDRAVNEAEALFTVGLQTRPIVHLVGGGDAEFRGVQFTAEGNIEQNIGQNFLINSQGSFLVNTVQDTDYLATGAVNIVSLGTNPVGKNVVFETDGELDVSAANVQINANRRITFYSDELLQFKSTGTNPTNSYISIDVVDDLRSYVAKTMDFNAADWTWTATTSFEFLTLGNVEFVNSQSAGSITVSADSDLEFISDVNMVFGTTGPNADFTLSTVGSNSNIVVQTWYESSDINFNGVGKFQGTSVNEMVMDSHGPASIVAPYDEVGSAALSTINFNSADDYSLLAAGGLTVQANDGLTLATGGTGSDFEVDSDGAINVFVWQNGVFSSVKDTLSFTTGYNFTFANQPDQGGQVVFQSSRDIVQNYGRDITIVSGDDQFFTAARTFEFTLKSGSSSELSVTTVNEDADINVSAKLGPVILHTYENINFNGGDTYFTASTTASINVDSFSLTTSGIHDKAAFDAAQKLTFNGGDVNFITDVQTTNGLGYQDFQATGKSSAGYAIRFASSQNTNVIAADGGVSLWAATSITSTSQTLSFYADNFFPLAGYGLAVSASDGTLTVSSANVQVTSSADDIVTLTKDTITILPFETSTFQGAGSSQEFEDVGVLIQSNHESADIRIFTTDFLTANMEFTGAAMNLFAEESITLLLLDDDDQAFVGTYLWEADSINVAAENEIYVRETSTGDITFTGSGAHYFTAGDMLTVTAREQLFFSAANWGVDSTGSFTIGGAQIDYNLSNQFVTYASESLIVNADVIGIVSTGNAEISVGDNNAQDGDPNGMLTLLTQDTTTFTSTVTVNMNVDVGVAVDFRDGLKIPFLTGTGLTPGVTGCLNTLGGPSSFFYEQSQRRLCYCDVNTIQCVAVSPIQFIP